jgi:hypothetical protein
MVLDVGVGGKILTAGVNRIRWQAGKRLAELFEARCDRLRRLGHAGDLAVDGPAAADLRRA